MAAQRLWMTNQGMRPWCKSRTPWQQTLHLVRIAIALESLLQSTGLHHNRGQWQVRRSSVFGRVATMWYKESRSFILTW